MIITCPNCDTRYLVPETDIGAEGRRVRCANCMHLWFAEPPTVTLDLGQRQMVEPAPEEPAPSLSEPPPQPEPARPPDPPRPGHFPDPAPLESDVDQQPDPPRPSAHHDPAPVEANRPSEPAAEATEHPVQPLSGERTPTADEASPELAEEDPMTFEDEAGEAADEPAVPSPAPEAPDVTEFLRRSSRRGEGRASRRGSANLPAIRVEAARWVPYGWAALGVFVVAVMLSLYIFRDGVSAGWPASERLYALFASPAEAPPAATEPATARPAETAATGAHPSTFVSIGYPDPPYEINRRAGSVILTILPEIRNAGAVPVDLPAIRGVLRNDQGAEVHSWQFQPDPARLEPGVSRKYRTEVSVSNPAQVKEFELLLQWPTSPS